MLGLCIGCLIPWPPSQQVYSKKHPPCLFKQLNKTFILQKKIEVTNKIQKTKQQENLLGHLSPLQLSQPSPKVAKETKMLEFPNSHDLFNNRAQD